MGEEKMKTKQLSIVDALTQIFTKFSKKLTSDIRLIIREEIEYALEKRKNMDFSNDSFGYDEDDSFDYSSLSPTNKNVNVRREIMEKYNPASRKNSIFDSSDSIKINPNEIFEGATLADGDNTNETVIPRNPEIEQRIIRDYSNLI